MLRFRTFTVLIALVICSIYHESKAQVSVIKMNDFEQLKNAPTDTTYIFNFWATWCKPCVKELPFFEEVNKKYASQKVKVLFISLDFIKDLNTRLIPFVEQQKLQTKVYLLNEPDYNSWIDKVDSNWGGAIPATLIVNNKYKRHSFYEKDFTLEELEEAIKNE